MKCRRPKKTFISWVDVFHWVPTKNTSESSWRCKLHNFMLCTWCRLKCTPGIYYIKNCGVPGSYCKHCGNKIHLNLNNCVCTPKIIFNTDDIEYPLEKTI